MSLDTVTRWGSEAEPSNGFCKQTERGREVGKLERQDPRAVLNTCCRTDGNISLAAPTSQRKSDRAVPSPHARSALDTGRRRGGEMKGVSHPAGARALAARMVAAAMEIPRPVLQRRGGRPRAGRRGRAVGFHGRELGCERA